jgi:AGZA family xanthine/uracil permease-like MFS transporter
MAPPHAYGIALIMIGPFKVQPITKIDFEESTELIPAFLTIVLKIFSYNTGVGMTSGPPVYPLPGVCTGKGREVPAGIWVLAPLSLTCCIFYPHR